MTKASGHRRVHFVLMGAAFPQSSGGESTDEGEMFLVLNISVAY